MLLDRAVLDRAVWRLPWVPAYFAVHPRFAGLTSHHFNESAGFSDEFRRRGRRFEILANVKAGPEITGALAARAVFEDPTFRLEFSFRERGLRFVAQLHEHLDARLRRNDRVFLTVSTQLEAFALTEWIRELPAGRKPWIVILFVSDRWNRFGAVERDRQLAEFAVLRDALAAIKGEDARRMLIFTLTDALSTELETLLDVPVAVITMPLPYLPSLSTGAHTGADQRDHVGGVLVGVFGGLRWEKGSHRIPGIVRAAPGARFLLQLTNDTLDDDDLALVMAIAGHPRVSSITAAMSQEQYARALGSIDLAVFPYELIPYRQRTSGVFGECIANGIPVIAPRGTWLAEQIESGRASGIIVADLDAESFGRAIDEATVKLDELTRRAAELSAAWRSREGSGVFIDEVERRIADRRSSARPMAGRG